MDNNTLLKEFLDQEKISVK